VFVYNVTLIIEWRGGFTFKRGVTQRLRSRLSSFQEEERMESYEWNNEK